MFAVEGEGRVFVLITFFFPEQERHGARICAAQT
jgi:hypothetical protein